MVLEFTVLVLGAGASTPFGYPSGASLKRNICNDLLNPTDQNLKAKEIKELGFGYETINAFRQELFTSGAASIDEFLEYKTKYNQIGKIAIAQSLIQYESTEVLFTNEDWYHVLFRSMLTKDPNEFGNNKISIITFNYDRSLEQYLYTALMSHYEIEEKTAIDILKKIPFLHLHGQIGNLKWQNPNDFRDYKIERSLDELKRSSEGIKIIHEVESNENSSFVQAREHLNKANNIYFLGFGYHQTNIDRLKISTIDMKNKKNILGTSKGFYNKQRDEIRKRTSEVITIFNDNQWGGDTILKFLERNVSFI